MNKHAALLLTALAAAGCVPHESAIRQQQQHANELAAQCSAYGFTANTPEYSNCLMLVDQQQKAAKAQQQAAASASLNALSGALMQMGQPRVLAPPPQTPIHTQCWRLSNGALNCSSN